MYDQVPWSVIRLRSSAFHLQEAKEKKQAVDKAIEKYHQKKQSNYKLLCKRTARGQPIMKHQMEYLLEKIKKQKSQSQWPLRCLPTNPSLDPMFALEDWSRLRSAYNFWVFLRFWIHSEGNMSNVENSWGHVCWMSV